MPGGFHWGDGVTDLSREDPGEPREQRHSRLRGVALRCGRRSGPARTPRAGDAAGDDVVQFERGLDVCELLGRALRRVRRRRLLRLRLDCAFAVCPAALDRRLVNAYRFGSMGCDVVVGGANAVERRAIEHLFADRERMFSRFRPESELNHVNRVAGSVVQVPPPFAEMVELALHAARQTAGLVDPTLGAAIEAAGYDRDFAELTPSVKAVEPGARGRWRSVRLRGTLLHQPHGVILDLNGVVKGKTVDDALALVDGDGFVSAGGDLAVRGGVDVSMPDGGAVRVLEGGLATSSTV